MAGQAKPATIPHVAALDGLRGAAVAGVLLFHSGHLRGGYLGVDLFFTLSGFLITSLLLAESSRTGAVGLGGFWARRARRLLPALAVLMVGVAVYSATLAAPSELAQIRGDAFATLAYGANWREVLAHQDYWALFRAPSPLNHTWSLAIEEQFYVIWPLVFVGLFVRFRHSAAKAVLATSLVLAAASSVLMIALYDPTSSARAYYGTDTRVGAILLGAALAAWLALRGPTQDRTRAIALEVVGVLGAITLAVAWTRLDGQSPRLYRGGFLLCGLAATAVIAAVMHPGSRFLARCLSVRPLCLLGLVSYGVYLYHWPVDVVLDEQRVGFGGWPLFAVQTGATLAVAVASYRLIEQPIRHGALSGREWRVLTPAVATGLVLVLAVTTAGARRPATVITYGNPAEVARQTRLNAPPGAQRVMVVGDSVADILAQTMRTLHPNPPLAVFDAAQGGCIFPGDLVHEKFRLADGTMSIRPVFPCDPSWEAAALRHFRPQIVLWIVSNPGDQVWYRGHWIEPCAEPYASLYQRRLRSEAANLRIGGGRVVLTTAAYFGVGIADRHTDCDNRLRRLIARETHTPIVDLFAYMCPNRKCRAEQGGVTLRPDGLHYEGAGGRIVAQWIVDQIRALPPNP